ncbi:Lactate utilization protein A [Posidoniimonas polymericola]|uniref:Lactate utilization protein A n=1 Tax=Posidoniimonas polymericola TaxID=2528002 RepID=A0A5C5YR79_9BACT|nr:(Fe-S)-binding protein [Posidoniimonas polymericola]TWT77441.1 Lactate utilization protein A [Posidoniimonas polymericola]
MKVSLFIPCYVDQLYPQIGLAMAGVLERVGHEVDYPPGQTCCGQPAFNCGFQDDAREVAKHFLKTFADAELIGVPSGSCATMVRVFYRDLFEGTDLAQQAAAVAERTYEFSELLVDKLGVTDVGASLSGRATFHDGCHGLRELGIKDAPRKLLANVQGLELIEMAEAETCCGFGGTFAVKFPQISTAMAEVKSLSIDETEAQYVISNDPSCLLQISGYLSRQEKLQAKCLPKCLHLAEVLAGQ